MMLLLMMMMMMMMMLLLMMMMMMIMMMMFITLMLVLLIAFTTNHYPFLTVVFDRSTAILNRPLQCPPAFFSRHIHLLILFDLSHRCIRCFYTPASG